MVSLITDLQNVIVMSISVTFLTQLLVVESFRDLAIIFVKQLAASNERFIQSSNEV